jgi:hypothetical protein
MRFSTLLFPILALSASSTLAQRCRTGFAYCGHTLAALGMASTSYVWMYKSLHFLSGYERQLLQTMHDLGMGGSYTNRLFYCNGGPAGVVSLLQDCPSNGQRCARASPGQSDYCTYVVERVTVTTTTEETYHQRGW